MKKILLLIIMISISLSATENNSWDTLFKYNTKKLKEKTINKIIEDKKLQNKNILYKENIQKQIIERKNIPDFVWKKPKEYLIFVRKDYHKVSGESEDFVILDPSGWKKIIVDKKQEWEY